MGDAGAAAIGLLYLPWLPSFLIQARNTAAPWAIRPTIGDLFADPPRRSPAPSRARRAPRRPRGGLDLVVEPVANERPPSTLLGAIGLLTVAVGWMVAQVDPSWTSRYLAVALGAAPARRWRASWPEAGRPADHRSAAASLLAGWSLIGSLLPDPNARYAKSNVAAVARAARPVLRPGRPGRGHPDRAARGRRPLPAARA